MRKTGTEPRAVTLAVVSRPDPALPVALVATYSDGSTLFPLTIGQVETLARRLVDVAKAAPR